MKKLPIGIQTFAKIRDPEENYVYIDKTDVISELVNNGSYYFLSRPRRFGKSVLLSTLAELFSANKGLFSGLYIEDKWNWQKSYPVIRISFGSGQFNTKALLDEAILENLKANYGKLNLHYDASLSTRSSFINLIKQSSEQYQEKVVILIDEYDKPILDHITEPDLARFNRDVLKGFYSTIKDLDECIKFVMITGVSKFAKMNLFSGLNNLQDISINQNYGTLCGYTHAQVADTFTEHLQGVDMDKLQQWYNGYNYFGEPIYNPFDILLFIANNKEYKNYWWGTGNPSFLIDKLKEQNYYLPDVQNFVADDIVLDTFDVDKIDLVALLWQTGYLTFADKWEGFNGMQYRLKVPNKEVQQSLNTLFIEYLTHQGPQLRVNQQALYQSLVDAKFDDLKIALSALFSSIPYNNYANKIIANYEGYYASVVYTYLASLGLPMVAEDVTNKGRIDLTLHFPDKIFIIEFKVDQAEKALAQIKAKNYQEKYLNQGKAIYLLGINFSSVEKNISDFEWQAV